MSRGDRNTEVAGAMKSYSCRMVNFGELPKMSWPGAIVRCPQPHPSALI